jgi:hypothetical protein
MAHKDTLLAILELDCMQATIATFFGLPAATKRSYMDFILGSY